MFSMLHFTPTVDIGSILDRSEPFEMPKIEYSFGAAHVAELCDGDGHPVSVLTVFIQPRLDCSSDRIDCYSNFS